MKHSRKHSGITFVGTLIVLTWIFVAYLGLTCIIYRFKHPKLTETELFLNLNNSLTWNMERVN